MSIEADDFNVPFKVRLRFTDGNGHYSRSFTVNSVTPTNGDEEPIIEFPFSEPMDGEELTGGLFGSATYGDAGINNL